MKDWLTVLPKTAVWPRAVWNIVIGAVLVFGSGFIWSTRAVPVGGAPPAARGIDAPGRDPAPLPDHPAPDFTLTTSRGETVQLSSLKGQVVLINVWATWCPPCRVEMPAIQAAYTQYREQGFTVLAVNLQEPPSTVSAFMDEERLTFPALLDTDGRVSATYQARVLPSSYFVDRDGVIRAVYRGPMPRGVIAGVVEQLLQEVP